MPSVSSLLKDGRLIKVVADLQAGQDKLEDCRRHLASAEKILDTDPEGAYSLLYDAARKSIDALLLAHGLRVANRPGLMQRRPNMRH